MKNLLSYSFLFLSIHLFSQEKLIDFYNSLKKTESVLEGVVPIVNENNDQIAIVILDAKKAYGYLIGSDFEIKKQLISKDRSRKYKVTIGSSLSKENEYRIYLSNNNRNEFTALTFSFDNEVVSHSEIDIKLENETFVQTIVDDDKFHLITVTQHSSILNIYSFNDQMKHVKTEINLSEHAFTDRRNKNVFLSKLLTKNDVSTSVKISENTPNSISLGAEKAKIYFEGHQLFLALDQNDNFTQIVKIDFTTFESQFLKINKPFFEIKLSQKKTNSFIHGNKIFTIAYTKEDFIFTIKNIETDALIKEYSFNIEDAIDFKNTPVMRTISGEFINSKSKELKSTSKFLRKLNVLEGASIAVFERDGIFQIALGGKEALQVSGIGSLMGIHKTEAFSSYNNSILVYIEGLFDKEFNHITGEIKKNAFEKIIAYKNESDYSSKGKKVFKYKNYYILGNYSYKSNKYTLRKFTE